VSSAVLAAVGFGVVMLGAVAVGSTGCSLIRCSYVGSVSQQCWLQFDSAL